MIRLFALMFALLAAPTAEACSCLQPDIASSYRANDHAFLGKVLSAQNHGAYRIYEVRVVRDLKTCMTRGTRVQIATNRSTAACRASLQVGERYALFAHEQLINGVPRLATNSCTANTLIGDVAAEDIDWLLNRDVTCDGVTTCNDGTAPYACLVAPCSVAASCPTGTCEDNYCGGCNAEYFDANGYQQCLP